MSKIVLAAMVFFGWYGNSLIGVEASIDVPSDVAPAWVPAYAQYKHLRAEQDQIAITALDDPKLRSLVRISAAETIKFFPNPPGETRPQWGRWWRNHKAELLLREMAVLWAKSGPSLTDQPPRAYNHPVFPEVNSGTAPAEIPDPELRRRFEAAIAANDEAIDQAETISTLVIERHRLLLSMEQLIEFFYKGDTAGRQEYLAMVSANAAPEDRPLLTAMAEKCGTGPASMKASAQPAVTRSLNLGRSAHETATSICLAIAPSRKRRQLARLARKGFVDRLERSVGGNSGICLIEL